MSPCACPSCSSKITDAKIIPSTLGSKAQVMVEHLDNWIQLFTFWDDELSFQSHEFIGLTCLEGHELFLSKDTAYLRS